MFFEKQAFLIFFYWLMINIQTLSSFSNEIMLGINTIKCGQRPLSARYKIVGGEMSRAGDWCVSF